MADKKTDVTPFVMEDPNTGDSGIDTSVTQSGGKYETRGQVRVATRHGHAFRPTNKGLPVIDSSGVNLTRENADEVIEEAAKATGDKRYVFEVTNAEDGADEA